MALRDDGAEPEVILDITGEVSQGSEQGLLGIAFAPDGRFLYINYTDVVGHTHVAEFRTADDGVDVASRRDVLFVEQPYSNHNGGNLAFGPDGYLYIGLGDGGSGGRSRTATASRCRPCSGKMLRIDAEADRRRPVRHPGRQPVRRPGRRPPGDLGLRAAEPVALLVRPRDRRPVDRGRRPERPGGDRRRARGIDRRAELRLEPVRGVAPVPGRPDPPQTRSAPCTSIRTGPAAARSPGATSTGARAIPDLVGAYVFADFCGGGLEAFVLRDGVAKQHRPLGEVVDAVASFGQDAAGELYVLSLAGPGLPHRPGRILSRTVSRARDGAGRPSARTDARPTSRRSVPAARASAPSRASSRRSAG